MKKQIITREILQKELLLKIDKYIKQYFKQTLPYIFLVILFFTILIVIFDALDVSFIVIDSLLFVIFIFVFISSIKEFSQLKRALKFRLYNLEIDQLNSKQRHGTEIYPSSYFYFRKYGMTTDLSSEFFKTFDVDVYDVAEQLDLFYLVVYKKQILCIYNTRFYALDEELQKELRT